MKVLQKLSLILVIFSAFSAVAEIPAESYQCSSYAFCARDVRRPGYITTYYGNGRGDTRAQAADAAVQDVKQTCEDDCTRVSGLDCHSVTVYKCDLKP